jgi:hypothetical protein
VSDDVLLPTDAEMDSRRETWKGYGASVVPDTLKRAEWAIKRLEKRAKEPFRAAVGEPDGL